jgi:membrane-associated PAP2 superfamily phosphatase
MTDDSPVSTPSPNETAARFGRGFAVRYGALNLVAVPLLLAVCALAVQYGPLDMRISALFVDARPSFPGQHARLLELLGHEGARLVPLLVGILAVVFGIAGFWSARLRGWRSILLTLGVAMVASTMAINALKPRTTLQCPTSIQEFGGSTPYAENIAKPFWARSRSDSGDCLPSGHAGGGYSLLALYFAGWASGRRSWRWKGLAIGIGAGLLFSVVRVVQGAHFASATVWSAAVVWTICALVFFPLLYRLARSRGAR